MRTYQKLHGESPFTTTLQQITELYCLMVCKILFSSEFHETLKKKEGENDNSGALCFTSKRNKKSGMT